MGKIFLYGPYLFILKFLYVLLFWLPALRKRASFELKNLREPLSHSFAKNKTTADICFEFSSEGEFQQIVSLVEDALELKQKVELVFFSPSVEKGVLDLAQKYPEQIRYLRYPILTFGFSQSFMKWITAKKLVMVRYDLFPEFLVWAKDPTHKLVMIWMTYKKERVEGKSVSFLKKLFLNTADKIIYASSADSSIGSELNLAGKSFDFRLEQIKRRMESREVKFQRVFPTYPLLQSIFKNYPREKRLIVGNAWPSDLHLLENIPSDFFVMIVPHKLEASIIEAFQEGLTKLNRTGVVLADQETALTSTVVLNKKGVLCELYHDFGRTYVGGGFEGSIHSVLEPFVSGTDLIACGPQNHRSTEFDLVESSGLITVVRNSQEFSTWLQLPLKSGAGHDMIGPLTQAYLEMRQDVLSC